MRRTLLAIVIAGSVAGCTGGAPILANPAAPRPSVVAPSIGPVAVADPRPIDLPRDDGPHDRLTEWWYYTGHLQTAGGRRYGFEYVIFRAERGAFPTSWASHLAVTDEQGHRFRSSQRLEVGPQVNRSPVGPDGEPTGFDLALAGLNPSDATTFGRAAWTMAGSGGTGRVAAALAPDEAAAAGSPAGLGLDLELVATKPPALHGLDGWVDFGAAGGSYYYSRTAMSATGTLTVDGEAMTVEGAAWFDHQWGDFIAIGGGGWDWFAVNLADGTDLSLSLVRDADGGYPLVYGTLVDRRGSVRHLDRDEFTVTVTDHWRSPLTGADYPAGWTIALPSEDLTIRLSPTVANQELDTRTTTGVVYWEGSQVVTASRGTAAPIGGEAYVELTGYGTAGAAGAAGSAGYGASGASPAPSTIAIADASRASSLASRVTIRFPAAR
jgi:predicted secreted hydrolase